MDCPVCKCPNPQGATHCGMCYEVFNRSAAQNYLHAVKRERRQAEGYPDESPVTIKSQRIIDDTKSAISRLDWNGLSQNVFDVIKRFRFLFLIGLGVTVLWM